MKRLGLVIVAVLAILLPAGLLSAPAGATTTVMGQDPGLYHDCWASPGGVGTTNYDHDWVNCQGSPTYDVWTAANEVENDSSGLGNSCAGSYTSVPYWQSQLEYPGSTTTYPDSIIESGTYPSADTVQINSDGTNTDPPCYGETAHYSENVWDWNALLDHNTNPKASSNGVESQFSVENSGNGAGNGGPLPGPQTAQTTADIDPTSYISQTGNNSSGTGIQDIFDAAEYMGFWDSCNIFVEAVFTNVDGGTAPAAFSQDIEGTFNPTTDYLQSTNGCMDYVSVNLGEWIYGTTSLAATNNGWTSLTVDWGSLIYDLQAGGYLPVYDGTQTTDAMGFAEQTHESGLCYSGTTGCALGANGWGPDSGLLISDVDFSSVTGQTYGGSIGS